jgi:hypothetical protein
MDLSGLEGDDGPLIILPERRRLFINISIFGAFAETFFCLLLTIPYGHTCTLLEFYFELTNGPA